MQVLGFRPTRMMNGSMYLPSVETIVIIGSNAPYMGSVLKRSSGGVGCAVATANSDKMMAYVVGFIVNPGNANLPLRTIDGNTAYEDGTLTKATTGDTFTAASDNVTDKQIAVAVMYSDNLVVSAYTSATAGTTTGSNKPGYFIDITNSYTLDETSASTSSAQFLLLEGINANSCLDPNDPSGRRVMAVANEIY